MNYLSLVHVFAFMIGTLCWLVCPAKVDAQDQQIILVAGAPGNEEYETQFANWIAQWQKVIQTENAKAKMVLVGTEVDRQVDDKTRLQEALKSVDPSTRELWIVLIGHGTDDRKSSKFNLRGPDVSATELNKWLKPLNCQTILINCASASGSFLTKLKANNRIVIAATKSGAQRNFARFGGYLAEAIADPALDLDKDEQTSLLEAFVAASNRTQEFYVQETRLATELATLDDNSDGRGTPADWFQGTRVIKQAKQGEPDGLAANQVFLVRRGAELKLTAEQRELRNELESKLEALRATKSTMTNDDYYQALEAILIQLANIYATMNDPDGSANGSTLTLPDSDDSSSNAATKKATIETTDGASNEEADKADEADEETNGVTDQDRTNDQ